ncbi:MAG: D-2-hydroxyacid dehydrogenase [Actinobacteria bacterium]|nr:D-2-hydroxyacid dehydrogenase [Actinomycetota bacterium]
MRIVGLDVITMDQGDMDWLGMQALGELQTYPRSAPDEIVPRSQDADAILINKVMIDAEVISSLPKLKYIGLTSTGTNAVDLDAARARGIAVTNVPGYASNSVAQHAMAMILHFASKIAFYDNQVHRGVWVSCPDFCFFPKPLIELDSKKLGIIGYGAIGRRVAQIARGLGMEILPYDLPQYIDSAECVPLDEVFKQADYLTIHCPLTPQTEGLINRERLSMMKPTAVLINTARGPIVNEPDLAQALTDGVIAGAGLDVLSVEPPSPDNPLLKAPNAVITPHVSWGSFEARSRLMKEVTENLRAFLNGRQRNRVESPGT